MTDYGPDGTHGAWSALCDTVRRRMERKQNTARAMRELHRQMMSEE